MTSIDRSKFDHIGIVTERKQPRESWVEATRVWVTSPRDHAYNIEFLRFEPDSPVTGPLRTEPHVAYRVDDLEAALDGIYVLRTSLAAGDASAQAVVRAYKQLEQAERAFRALKAPDLLALRPIHHRLEDRVRAHALLCMLAYAVRLEIEERLAELLFADDAPLAPANPVEPAQRSASAKAKAASKRTASGLPAHSLLDLLDALATLTRNRIRLAGHPVSFDQLAEQNPLQRRAFQLLQVNPGRL